MSRQLVPFTRRYHAISKATASVTNGLVEVRPALKTIPGERKARVRRAFLDAASSGSSYLISIGCAEATNVTTYELSTTQPPVLMFGKKGDELINVQDDSGILFPVTGANGALDLIIEYSADGGATWTLWGDATSATIATGITLEITYY